MESKRRSSDMGYDDKPDLNDLKRKKRAANFTEEEKFKLLHLLQEKGQIIINKVATKGLKTNKAKDAAWDEICEDLNSTGSVMRSTDTLKKLWANLKCEAKTYKPVKIQQDCSSDDGSASMNVKNVMDVVVELIRCGNSGESPAEPTVSDCASDHHIDNNNVIWLNEVVKEDIDQLELQSESDTDESFTRLLTQEPTTCETQQIQTDSQTRAYAAAKLKNEKAKLELINLKIQQEKELHKLRMEQEQKLFEMKKNMLEKILKTGANLINSI